MKNIKKNDMFIWSIKVIIMYFISFLLCQHDFFVVQKSEQWPIILFLFGITIIIISSLFYLKKTMVFTVSGYIFGYLFAKILNKNGIDPGGGRTNNLWMIWLISFLIIIIIGIIWEIIDRRIKSK